MARRSADSRYIESALRFGSEFCLQFSIISSTGAVKLQASRIISTDSKVVFLATGSNVFSN